MKYGALVSALLLMWTGARASVERDFSRYQVILDRQPFGAVEEPERAAPPPQPQQPPDFVQHIRMCAITEDSRGVMVGLVDSRRNPPRTYYLAVGDSEEGIELLDADYDREAALIGSGGHAHWFFMGRAGAVAAASHPQHPAGARPPPDPVRRESYAERLRQRRQALAERMTAPPALTGEALEQHLKEYQMDLIRRGMPPLPIPLTQEMDDKLVEEGVLQPMGN